MQDIINPSKNGSQSELSTILTFNFDDNLYYGAEEKSSTNEGNYVEERKSSETILHGINEMFGNMNIEADDETVPYTGYMTKSLECGKSEFKEKVFVRHLSISTIKFVGKQTLSSITDKSYCQRLCDYFSRLIQKFSKYEIEKHLMTPIISFLEDLYADKIVKILTENLRIRGMRLTKRDLFCSLYLDSNLRILLINARLKTTDWIVYLDIRSIRRIAHSRAFCKMSQLKNLIRSKVKKLRNIIDGMMQHCSKRIQKRINRRVKLDMPSLQQIQKLVGNL